MWHFRQVPRSTTFTVILAKRVRSTVPAANSLEAVHLSYHGPSICVPDFAARGRPNSASGQLEFHRSEAGMHAFHATVPVPAPSAAPTEPAAPATTKVPVAIPPPAAATAPPPHAASDAFASAAPDNVEIAVPVVAVAPKRPVATTAAAIGAANSHQTPVPPKIPTPILNITCCFGFVQ